MYTKTLVGLIYVLHMLSSGLALPANGFESNVEQLSPENVDQAMSDAIQTLLAGLVMKGQDLRADLQAEARALLEDPFPFDEETLAEVAKLANQEVNAAVRVPEPPAGAEEDAAEDSVAREADDVSKLARAARSLVSDTLDELSHERYGRAEVPAEPEEPHHHTNLPDELRHIIARTESTIGSTIADAEQHHRLSDFFHLPSLSTLFGEPYPYPMDPNFQQPAPLAPVADPAIPDTPAVPVPDPVVDPLTPPVVEPPAVPEVPPPVARSADEYSEPEPSEEAEDN